MEALEQISMAFLVVLQRLTPAERAVLLLREVFDFDYEEIAALVGKSEPACRKLLERARQHVAAEKPLFAASPEDHRRLLGAFSRGRIGGEHRRARRDARRGRGDGDRRRPRRSACRRHSQPPGSAHGCRQDRRVRRGDGAQHRTFEAEVHELNGQPALVFYHQDEPFAALLLAIANGRIHRVFFHADLERLRYVGPRTTA